MGGQSERLTYRVRLYRLRLARGMGEWQSGRQEAGRSSFTRMALKGPYMDRHRSVDAWWVDADRPNLWRLGYPTYWVLEYRGHGLWAQFGGDPWGAYWNLFKGNPWHGSASVVIDSGEEEGIATGWADFTKRRERMNEKLKAALAKAKATANPEEAADKDLEKRCPILHGFLTTRESGVKGVFRETASLTIFTEDGLFKACLSDRESGSTLWHSASTLQGTIEGLEASLGKDEPGWRVRRSQGQAKGKGKR